MSTRSSPAGTDEEKGGTSTEFPTLKPAVSLVDQSSRVSQRKMVVIFLGLGFSLATAYTKMGVDLNAGQTISWVGTSYLVANTSSQLIYGRASDIFGRKTCLMTALLILGIGDLLCGFAQTSLQLFVFRAIAGGGAGGINNMAMVIMSDVTSLKDRAKWQGYIAGSVALGSAAGPFVGAVITEHVTWRWLFWILPPCNALCMLVVWKFIPLKPVTGSMKAKLLKVDYLGCLVSLAANIMILVAVSSGGSLYAWNSPTVIALFVVGGALWATFLLIEWKFAKLPIMPLRLFTYRSPGITFVSTWLIGYVYYGNLFYLPRYFQTLRKYSATVSAALLLCLLLIQSAGTAANGRLTTRLGQVKDQIIVGFALWTVSLGLQTMFNETISVGAIVGLLLFQGIATGTIIQTTLVAAQAGAPSADRAVVTAIRNFERTFGGAFGLAISNTILQNTLNKKLPANLPASVRDSIINGGTLDLPDYIDQATKQACYDAYNKGIYYIFVSFVPKDRLNGDPKPPPPPAETLADVEKQEAAVASTTTTIVPTEAEEATGAKKEVLEAKSSS
ncbi:MFS general substrate transporter [Pseudohyphozyma bogoriensis]|nr:MFS general substrate transporter [Pseudohyphozyma bogoriensis]